MGEPLTTKRLENLKPKAEAYEVSDGSSGLRLRVTPAGLKVWRWHYRPAPGAPQRVVTLGYFTREGAPEHLGLAAARNKLDELQGARREHRLDEVLGGGPGAPGTVGELAERFYRLRILPHRNRPEVVRDALDRDILPRLGHRKLSAFSTAACRSVVEAVIERGATTYAGRVLQVLKQLGRFGQASGHLSGNPAAPLEGQMLGVLTESSDRWLTSEEIVLWWKALDAAEMTPTVRLGLRFLLFTGLRTGEFLKATWADADLDDKEGPTLTVPVASQKLTKKAARAARPFVLPLAPAAKEILAELQKLAGKATWVLYSPDANKGKGGPLTDKALARAMRRLWEPRRMPDGKLAPLLKIPQASPHDLRRTMRTHYESSLGIEPHVAERALNHSLGRIVTTYTRGDYLPARRDAALRWADFVTRIVRGEDAKVIGIGGSR
jgi:integrase